jgi:hypothetical protein
MCTYTHIHYTCTHIHTGMCPSYKSSPALACALRSLLPPVLEPLPYHRATEPQSPTLPCHTRLLHPSRMKDETSSLVTRPTYPTPPSPAQKGGLDTLSIFPRRALPVFLLQPLGQQLCSVDCSGIC